MNKPHVTRALRASHTETSESVTDHWAWSESRCTCDGSGPFSDRDESPQQVTYQEALFEGANPDEGFYE